MATRNRPGRVSGPLPQHRSGRENATMVGKDVTLFHPHPHVHTHFFLLKNLSGTKGTYMNKELSLFVPGKKGLEQPGNSPPSPHLGLSLCLSLSNTHLRVRAHALPKDGSGTLARQPCRGWRVPWNLSWSLGCVREDSKPCENCPAF